MKHSILILFLLLPLAAMGQGKPDYSWQSMGAEGTKRDYDAQGRQVGRSETSNGTTRYYDSQGRNVGRAETNGNTTREYDAQGRMGGRSETKPSEISPLAYADWCRSEGIDPETMKA